MKKIFYASIIALSAVLSMQTTANAEQITVPAENRHQSFNTTSELEKKRVDNVSVSLVFGSAKCDVAECADINLPLDYDDPNGPKVRVRVGKMPAGDPQRRVGNLFINPGGPGGSAIEAIEFAKLIFPAEITERFDLIAVEPRGGGQSQQIECFNNPADRDKAMSAMYVQAFPETAAEAASMKSGYEAFGRACSTTGTPLSAAVSTAQVARDHEVVRRALGSEKMTYLGLSYGSVLGQTYAALFPDRVRAIAIDGVTDLVSWHGENDPRPAHERFGDAASADRSMVHFLELCQKVGAPKCAFASHDTKDRFIKLAEKIAEKPVKYGSLQLDRSQFSKWLVSALYSHSAPLLLANGLTGLEKATTGESSPEELSVLLSGINSTVATFDKAGGFSHRPSLQDKEDPTPFYNRVQHGMSVYCSESGTNPTFDQMVGHVNSFNRFPYAGQTLVWGVTECSSFTAKDEDRLAVPSSIDPAFPMLIVGSNWDPATPIEGATKAGELSPSSKIIHADNWGHVAYGGNKCAINAINKYLTDLALPKEKLTRCVDDKDPFIDSDD